MSDDSNLTGREKRRKIREDAAAQLKRLEKKPTTKEESTEDKKEEPIVLSRWTPKKQSPPPTLTDTLTSSDLPKLPPLSSDEITPPSYQQPGVSKQIPGQVMTGSNRQASGSTPSISDWLMHDSDDPLKNNIEPTKSNWKARLTLAAASAAITLLGLVGYEIVTKKSRVPHEIIQIDEKPDPLTLRSITSVKYKDAVVYDNAIIFYKQAPKNYQTKVPYLVKDKQIHPTEVEEVIGVASTIEEAIKEELLEAYTEENLTITFDSDQLWKDEPKKKTKEKPKQKEVVKKKNPTKLDFQKVMEQGKCYRTRGSYYFAFSKPHKGFVKGRQYKLSSLSLMWVLKKSVDPKAKYQIPCSGLVTRLPLAEVRSKGACYQITFDGGRERDTFMFREGQSPLDKGFRPRQHYRVDHKARVLHTIYREGVLETVQKVECTKLLQKAQ